MQNKITNLRIIFKDLSLDYFVLSETKLDGSFPTGQFTLEGYEIWIRNDRDKYGGGLIEFIKNGLFVEQYLSIHLIKLNVSVQNLPFQKVSGFVSVYTGHPYLVT